MTASASVLMETLPLGVMPRRPERMLRLLVSSVSSDAHTWNLVFLQLLLEELGHEVINLGACTPDDLIIDSCRREQPDILVISSVNGHATSTASA